MVEKMRQPFSYMRFAGGRFDESEEWLDFAVLKELDVYRTLIVETASDLWRQEHPYRVRLPSGFSKNFHLGISGLGGGSCAVRIDRVVEGADYQRVARVPDSYDIAVKTVDETLLAVRHEEMFPKGMTRRILRLFERWGTTLEDNESMILGESAATSPMFNTWIKEQLVEMLGEIDQSYEYSVDMVGEILAVNVNTNPKTFDFKTEHGGIVKGIFEAEQELLFTYSLHQHKTERLWLRGRGEFEPSGRLKRIIQVDFLKHIQAGSAPYDPDAPSISELFKQIRESVPESAWSDLPTDGAKNYKHYLYGWPKEDER